MKATKKKTIKVEIYRAMVHVYTGDALAVIERIKKEYGVPIELGGAGAYMFMLDGCSGEYFVYVPDLTRKSMFLLAHEMLHVVFAITRDLGIAPTEESEEA
jgi:hypothetical protein